MARRSSTPKLVVRRLLPLSSLNSGSAQEVGFLARAPDLAKTFSFDLQGPIEQLLGCGVVRHQTNFLTQLLIIR